MLTVESDTGYRLVNINVYKGQTVAFAFAFEWGTDAVVTGRGRDDHRRHEPEGGPGGPAHHRR